MAPPGAAAATVTAVPAVPGATVHVFDAPPDLSAGVEMSAVAAAAALAAVPGAAGAAPAAVAAAVSLARVEARAASRGSAAIYLRVTSADGSRKAFYTVAVRRSGVGVYEGGGGHNGYGGPRHGAY